MQCHMRMLGWPLQIGVGAVGGLGKLLVMAQCHNPEPATAAAKALAGLVACNTMLQEALLEGGCASILVKLLDASPYTVTGMHLTGLD